MILKARMFVISLVLSFLNFAHAQEFEDFVAAYTGDNGIRYLQPLGNALGANLNSGLFHSAKIPKMKLNLELSLVSTTAIISSSEKTFEATPDPSFQPSGASTIMAPTIFGDTRSVTLPGEGGTATTFPGGTDIGMLPILLPQFRIGGVLGTDFTIRYFAFEIDEELGRLQMFGWGVRHSISQYLPDVFPVDLALAYYQNSIDLENFSETSTSLLGIQGSIHKGLLGVYSSIGYETASNEFNYTYTGDDLDENVNLVLEDQNSIRFTIGAALNLGPFFINTDYNLGINQVLSLGLGFEIGNK